MKKDSFSLHEIERIKRCLIFFLLKSYILIKIKNKSNKTENRKELRVTFIRYLLSKKSDFQFSVFLIIRSILAEIWVPNKLLID